MCSTYEDEDRFIKLINSAITAKTLTSFPAWKKAIKDSKAQEKRKSKAVREAGEAEAYAKEMGVHDKLFSKKGKGKGKATQEEEEASLKALIQGNQVKRMDSIIGSIEAKYVNQESNRKKKRNSEEGGDGNKKQKTEIEPSEEEFLKLQKEMDARRKSSGNGEEKKKGKKGRGSL